jgi:disulfide bond formation protein DsbB
MPTSPRIPFQAILLTSIAIIGYVLFAQHIQHYAPCELCLRERWPWYLLIGLSLIGLIFPSRRLLVLIGLILLISAGLGLHHAGVEQHWWPGPAECTSGSSGAKTIDELKAMLMKEKVTQCDEIAWKFLGLSMAAWNGLASLIAGAAILIFAGRRNHA